MKQQKNSKFYPEVFISTDQRCGGTALNDIARALLQAPCVDEPWSENWLNRSEPELPCTFEDHPAVNLNRLYLQWHCIKNCTTLWPAEIYQPILDAAIERNCHIVLLWRENALQRALSLELAKKTRVFGNYDWTEEPKVANYDTIRVKLEVESVVRSVHNYQQRTIHVRQYLKNKRANFIEIRYEDLFSTTNDYESKRHLLLHLCEFWQIDFAMLETQRARLELLLAPTQKLNSHDLYQKMVVNFSAVFNALDPKLQKDFWTVY